jgi:ketosteroid isomerase-like protein
MIRPKHRREETMTTTRDATAELLALEEQRCAAINRQDWDALAAMLSDDLVHVHANGLTQDKAVYMQHVSSRPRRTERSDLVVRVHGETAVMTGKLVNLMEGAAAGADTPVLTAMQVWVRTGDTWKQAAFQATRIS